MWQLQGTASPFKIIFGYYTGAEEGPDAGSLSCECGRIREGFGGVPWFNWNSSVCWFSFTFVIFSAYEGPRAHPQAHRQMCLSGFRLCEQLKKWRVESSLLWRTRVCSQVVTDERVDSAGLDAEPGRVGSSKACGGQFALRSLLLQISNG